MPSSGHILLGYDLSLVSLMGVIALSGVVINDSLIMIDYANRCRVNHSAFEAIISGGRATFSTDPADNADNVRWADAADL